MKLWLLEPNPTRCGIDRWDSMTWKEKEAASRANPWAIEAFLEAPWSMLIRASSEDEARRLASRQDAEMLDHVPRAWLDPALSLCVEITTEGEPGILLVERTGP